MRGSGRAARLLSIVLCTAGAFCGCTSTEHGVGMAASALPGAEVELHLVQERPDRLEFVWRFTNHHPFAVFLPTKWKEVGLSPWHEKPVKLVVPPSDLLLAYAPVICSWEQAREISLDYALICDYQRVGPGHSLEGRCAVELPFQACREYDGSAEQQLRSVFLYKGGYPDNTLWPEERQAEVSELSTVSLAVQYSLVGPHPMSEGSGAYQEVYRLSVIDQALRGEKRKADAFDGPVMEQLVVSAPVRVRIPLKEPIVLHFNELLLPIRSGQP